MPALQFFEERADGAAVARGLELADESAKASREKLAPNFPITPMPGATM